jgi:hypothetical protein
VEGKRRVLLIIHPIQIRTPAGRSLVADHSHVQNWIQLTSNLDGLSRSSADGGETGSIGKRCKRWLPRLGCPFALPHASRARPRHRLQRTSCCGRRVVVWLAETDTVSLLWLSDAVIVLAIARLRLRSRPAEQCKDKALTQFGR